jgi:hypothetical protein
MFIHCIWIYSGQYQRKSRGCFMIEAFVNDTKIAGMNGVAVSLFLANAFEPVDTPPPDC